jgi:hypothetical protein
MTAVRWHCRDCGELVVVEVAVGQRVIDALPSGDRLCARCLRVRAEALEAAARAALRAAEAAEAATRDYEENHKPRKGFRHCLDCNRWIPTAGGTKICPECVAIRQADHVEEPPKQFKCRVCGVAELPFSGYRPYLCPSCLIEHTAPAEPDPPVEVYANPDGDLPTVTMHFNPRGECIINGTVLRHWPIGDLL